MLRTFNIAMPRQRMRFVTHRVWLVTTRGRVELHYLKMTARSFVVQCRFASLQRALREGWKLALVFRRAMHQRVLAVRSPLHHAGVTYRSTNTSQRGGERSSKRVLVSVLGETPSRTAFMYRRPVVKNNDASMSPAASARGYRSAWSFAPMLSLVNFRAHATFPARRAGVVWTQSLVSRLKTAIQTRAKVMLRQVSMPSKSFSSRSATGTSQTLRVLRHLLKTIENKPATRRYGHRSATERWRIGAGTAHSTETSVRSASSLAVINYRAVGREGNTERKFELWPAKTASGGNIILFPRISIIRHIHALPGQERGTRRVGSAQGASTVHATQAQNDFSTWQPYTAAHRTALVYRQVTPIAPVNLTKQVQRIEHQITRKVVHEIVQATPWRQQVEKALLTPGIVHELAQQVSNMMLRRSGLERYRRGL